MSVAPASAAMFSRAMPARFRPNGLPSLLAGIVTRAENAPFGSTGNFPRFTGLECSVSVTSDSGIQPLPEMVMSPPARTVVVSTAIGTVVVFGAMPRSVSLRYRVERPNHHY